MGSSNQEDGEFFDERIKTYDKEMRTAHSFGLSTLNS